MKVTLGTKIWSVILILFMLFVMSLIVDAVRYNMRFQPGPTTSGDTYDWPCVVGQPDC